MSIYNFLPNKPRIEATHSFVTWQNGFDASEITKLIELCESLEKLPAEIGDGDNGTLNKDVRRSNVAWLRNTPDTAWIYDRLAFITRSLNSQFYRYNLYGFIEDMQYTVYSDSDEGHYTWHIDLGPNNECTRKLSVVLQLSSPDEYEGGELQILSSAEPTTVVKEKGLIAAFPSFILHRVTPVTKGTRRTLVVWSAGPDFV